MHRFRRAAGVAPLAVLLATAFPGRVVAQQPDNPARLTAAQERSVSLGLPRHGEGGPARVAVPLSPRAFEVEQLTAADGRAGTPAPKVLDRDGLRLLALDAGAGWGRPLRGGSAKTIYVSLGILASPGTVINLGGAVLDVPDEEMGGAVMLRRVEPQGSDRTWKPVGILVGWDSYDGRKMAALPILTVRIDPAAGTWNLYAAAKPVADSLPLPGQPGALERREISVVAGKEGAWIRGLVQSDENPLFEDANANGMDDDFERARFGGNLMAADAIGAEKRDAAREWRALTRMAPAPALFVQAPQPDRVRDMNRR